VEGFGAAPDARIGTDLDLLAYLNLRARDVEVKAAKKAMIIATECLKLELVLEIEGAGIGARESRELGLCNPPTMTLAKEPQLRRMKLTVVCRS
jgi:hypothetical protein